MRPLRALLLTALAALLVSGPAGAEPDRGPFKKIAVLRLREDSGQAIDPSFKTSTLRRLRDAREWGADCIILDIESYGGLVTASLETSDEVFALGREIHTIAYVGRKAISGAAMLSMSCQEVVVSPTGSLGDSQVIYQTPEGVKVAPEKFQTTVAAAFRKYAEGNGYPVPLAEAMVRIEMEVTRYKKPEDPDDPDAGFTWVYYRTDRIGDGPTRREMEELGLYDPEVVVRGAGEDAGGELATFTPQEAVGYGIASRIEPTLDDLIESIRAEDGVVRSFEWNWAERTSRFLLNIRGLLFLIGIGALYFALKMPGTGIPEGLALVCFGLFFGASYVVNLAGALEVVLFFVGILLLAVEIFVIPGFGVAGFLGLGCILVSVGLAAVPDGGTPDPVGIGDLLVPMARDFLLYSTVGIVLVMFLARNLPSVPLFRRLALAAPTPATPAARGGDAEAPDEPDLVGSRGVAATVLRPSGRARVDGETRDVVAESGYIPKDAPVRVIAVRGNVVVVRHEPGDDAR